MPIDSCLAFLPDNGKCLNDYSIGASRYDDNVREHGEGWRLPFAGTLSLEMLGITDPADMAWMAPRMVDQPYRTFTQPVAIPEVPASHLQFTYLLSSERAHYLEAARRAEARGYRIVHVPGAGHDVMVTQATELTRALLSMC